MMNIDAPNLREIFKKCPMIAAVKNDHELNKALNSNSKVVFVLYGDLLSISEIVQKIKLKKKVSIVHLDLIQGLSNKEVAVDYIIEYTLVDGIISTKPNLIKAAKKNGLITVQRVFLLDSLSLKTLYKILEDKESDFIEVLPGVIHKVTQQIIMKYNKPIIAGGLILDQEDVNSSLRAGATAISTSNHLLW